MNYNEARTITIWGCKIEVDALTSIEYTVSSNHFCATDKAGVKIGVSCDPRTYRVIYEMFTGRDLPYSLINTPPSLRTFADDSGERFIDKVPPPPDLLSIIQNLPKDLRDGKD